MILRIGGDLLFLTLFAISGRISHSYPVLAPETFTQVLLPFALSWLLIAVPAGLYRADTACSFKKTVLRLPPAWAVAATVAVFLRGFILGRSIETAVVPVFLLIAGIIGFLFLLAWRLIYIFIINRRGAR